MNFVRFDKAGDVREGARAVNAEIGINRRHA
jgi:hypothetical protein